MIVPLLFRETIPSFSPLHEKKLLPHPSAYPAPFAGFGWGRLGGGLERGGGGLAARSESPLSRGASCGQMCIFIWRRAGVGWPQGQNLPSLFCALQPAPAIWGNGEGLGVGWPQGQNLPSLAEHPVDRCVFSFGEGPGVGWPQGQNLPSLFCALQPAPAIWGNGEGPGVGLGHSFFFRYAERIAGRFENGRGEACLAPTSSFGFLRLPLCPLAPLVPRSGKLWGLC